MSDDVVNFYKKFGLPEPKPFSTKLKIHIGDKSLQLGLILKHSLEKHGFEVHVHKDGLVALEFLKAHRADVVLEDENLPSVNGYDILRELSEDPLCHRPAFIVLADTLNKNSTMLAVERGVDDILVRPVTEKAVFQKIMSAYNNFINPKNPEVVYEYAKQKIREENYDKAIEVYRVLAAHSEKIARPFVGLGRIHFAKKNYQEALSFATKGIEKNENYIHAYTLRGEVYLQLDDIQNAYLDFKKAVELSPLNLARYQKCSEILLTQNKITECINLLNLAINAGIEHHYIDQKLGHCYFVQKEYPKALKFLKQAVRLEPENVSYTNSLAICYRDAKDFEMAIQTYNKMLKNDPDNHHILFNKSLALIMNKEKEDAVKILLRIVKLNPAFEKAKEKLAELEVPLVG